jgi:hypothetical protein
VTDSIAYNLSRLSKAAILNEAPPATAVTLEERSGGEFVGNVPIELRQDREMPQHIVGNLVLSLHCLKALSQRGIVLCRRRIEIPAHRGIGQTAARSPH